MELIKTQHLKYDERITEMQKQIDECERDRAALREDLVNINRIVSLLQEQVAGLRNANSH